MKWAGESIILWLLEKNKKETNPPGRKSMDGRFGGFFLLIFWYWNLLESGILPYSSRGWSAEVLRTSTILPNIRISWRVPRPFNYLWVSSCGWKTSGPWHHIFKQKSRRVFYSAISAGTNERNRFLWFLTNYITFLQKNKFFSSYWKKIHCLFINNIKKI